MKVKFNLDNSSLKDPCDILDMKYP